MSETAAWFLAGATATGKSSVAHYLADKLDASILSCDSMLVYRGMDIGTAKPSMEERRQIRYYGVDLVNPDENFSTGRWIEASKQAMEGSGKPLIAAGGTGLYIKAVTEGLEGEAVLPERRHYWQEFLEQRGIKALQEEIRNQWPEAWNSLDDPLNPRRLTRAAELLERQGKLPSRWEKSAGSKPRIPTLLIPREKLRRRIAKRVDQMVAQGLVEEVESLLQAFPVWSETAQKAIGYAEIIDYLQNACSLEEAKERIVIRTNHLAKRQETWFKHQSQPIWIPLDGDEPVEKVAEKVLQIWRKYGKSDLQR